MSGFALTAGAPVVWPFAAADKTALRAEMGALLAHVRADPESPAAVVRTLHRRLEPGRCRAAVVGESTVELVDGLAAIVEGRHAANAFTGVREPGGTVFAFPGQGGQWPGMAVQLLDEAPVFGEHVARCSAALEPFAGFAVLDVLRERDGAPALQGAAVVQPALYAVMVGLHALWRACGVEPDAVVGHSLGEVVAAAVTGALSDEDAARVVARWSRAQATLAGRGAMAFAALSEAEALPLVRRWPGRLSLAAVNGPNAVLVSGDSAAVAEFVEVALAEDVFARIAEVELAAHSTHIEAILPVLRAELGPLQPSRPALPLYSATLGHRIDGQPMNAEHWCRNLRETVRFHDAVDRAIRDGHRLLVEVSPHPVLTADMADTARRSGAPAAATATLHRGHGDAAGFVHALADAYVHGAPVRWTHVSSHPGYEESVID